MKQDEFIKEFKQYFGTDIGEIDRFSSRTIGDLDLFDFINHLLSKKPSVSDEEKADELREGERKIKDFEYCSNCLTIEVCRHARECKIQTTE